MAEGLERVKAELGLDAVIVSTNDIRRKGVLGYFQKPQVEIVVSYEEKDVLDPEAVSRFKQTRRNFEAQNRAATRYGGMRDPDEVDIPLVNPLTGEPVRSSTGAAGQSGDAQRGGTAAADDDDLYRAALGGGTSGATYTYSGVRPMQGSPGKGSDKSNRSGQSNPPDAKLSANEMQIEGLFRSFDERIGAILDRLESHNEEQLPSDILLYHNRLMQQGVAAELSASLAKKARSVMELRDMNAHDAYGVLLYKMLRRAEPIALGDTQKVIVMFGPTGVGKTTAIAKLAAQFVLERNARVSFMTSDVFRIAAVAQIKTYADIIGAPVSVVYSADEIPAALAQHKNDQLVFIDTAGHSPGDEARREETARIIEASGASDIFLVISATSSFETMRRIVNAYGNAGHYKIIVTKLDETEHPGSIINLMYLTKRPIAYITTGQNVPDDIEAFHTRNLLRQLLD